MHVGNDREVLEREIAVINELLEEQPDSKWCMESLVHYQSLLVRHHSVDSESAIKESLDLLEQLKNIDPARRQRYDEIGESHRSHFIHEAYLLSENTAMGIRPRASR